MIRSLCILLCLAFPAFAGKVTMTGTDCAIVSNGPDYTITCGPKVEPTPPIVPPVTPPVTPPVGTVCPVAPGVLKALLIDPVAGQARQVYAQVGQTWSGPLPAGRLQGGFVSSDYVGTPPMTVEWSLSPCQGDVSYYQSSAAVGTCGRTGGTQSGGVTWNTAPPPRNPACKIDTTRQWYVNYRVLSGCSESQWATAPDGSRGCPLNYQWN